MFIRVVPTPMSASVLSVLGPARIVLVLFCVLEPASSARVWFNCDATDATSAM